MTNTAVVTSAGEVTVTTNESGEGRPYLLLHGGAGPVSVARFSELLSADGRARAITPIMPGFQGTPRPPGLASVRDLAEVYSGLLDALELDDVVLVGNSIGGWVAAELLLRQNPRVRKAVLVDAGGLQIDAYPAADVFSLTLDEITERSYRHPEKFRIDPSKLPEPARAAIVANRAALKVYGGATMNDPTLLERLPGIRVPTLVVWGSADRVIPRQHGEAYAAAIPGAHFVLIDEAGHMPQLEAPETLLSMIQTFARGK